MCISDAVRIFLSDFFVYFTHFRQWNADWRRPPHPVLTADYATYVQILTWFLDTPAPAAPFSVHRMALAGKELGTDVGQWFGPSVAAGAIRYAFLSDILPWVVVSHLCVFAYFPWQATRQFVPGLRTGCVGCD